MKAWLIAWWRYLSEPAACYQEIYGVCGCPTCAPYAWTTKH
jgi:hypothetical protein